MTNGVNPGVWRSLEAEALGLLRHADSPPLGERIRGSAIALRLWRIVRRGASFSWSIIVPVREYRVTHAVVREVAWDRPADWRKALKAFKVDPHGLLAPPTIRLRDARIPWDLLAPFLDQAGRLPMGRGSDPPAMASEEKASGFEGFRSLAHVRLQWTGKGPREGHDSIAWFEAFRRVLVRVMKEDAASSDS